MKLDLDLFECTSGIARSIGRAARVVQAKSESTDAERIKGFEVALKKIARKLYVDGLEASEAELAQVWRTVQERRENKETQHTVEVLGNVLREKADG